MVTMVPVISEVTWLGHDGDGDDHAGSSNVRGGSNSSKSDSSKSDSKGTAALMMAKRTQQSHCMMPGLLGGPALNPG